MKILIIGGVAGGATAAARLRRLDEKAEIILFEKGGYISYANCGLPYYIGDVISDRDRLFVQTSEGFSAKYGVDTRVNSEVLSIDRKAKTVTVKDWKANKEYTESYDKLLISTGASPRLLNTKGIDDKRIFTLRDVKDTDAIKSYINEAKPKHAVVVGAGFIGLEMVENMRELGMDVSIVQREDQVMLPLDLGMAKMVQKTLADHSVPVYLEDEVAEFQDEGSNLKLHLKSGKTLNADMVLMSIGVQPETTLAKDAGLELGQRGGLKVNEFMQTSDESIYAVGDVVEVFNPVLNQFALIPLAGPANKQARIASDNIILGNKSTYKGSIGTAIAKIFDQTVASAGASSKQLNTAGIEHHESYTHGHSNANYYPGALPLTIKLNFAKKDGRILGAQVIGYKGVVDTINLLASAIQRGDTVYDLQEIEHAYAPPYSSAKHPVNIAGYVGQNVLENVLQTIHWNELQTLDKNEAVIVDVRSSNEFSMGHLDGAINIPVSEMRGRLSEISKDKKVILYCAVGYNGYLASQILKGNGYTNIYNLSGGYKLYTSVSPAKFEVKKDFENKEDINNTMQKEQNLISIDATGLMCPGPVMQLKKNYDTMSVGDQLEIKVTDQAFGQDLEGWSNAVGAKVLSIKSNEGVITARVEKQDDAQASGAEYSCSIERKAKSGNGQTMIVFSDDMDKALASFVIANGAVAMGKKVTLFFTFWGLNVIKKVNKPKVKKDIFGTMFGWMLPSSSKKLALSQMNMGGLGGKMMRMVMKKKNVDSLESLMQQAIDNGVEFIACSMSMDVMGIKEEELLDGVKIGGVAAYLNKASDANVNLFI